MASPFFFVAKKDGKLRPCQDYRYLNEHTIKNAYPIPFISQILDKLRDTKYFTKLDIRLGYNNVRIHEGDQWKAAFKTHKGLFEPTVMFFGMCNSPATFQAMMDSLFAELIAKGDIIVYMDDILIHAQTKEKLKRITREVLRILKKNDLYLKTEKCEFAQQKLEYLGVVIEPGKVSMDVNKLKGIQDWPTPTNTRDVRKFIGFCNFYRRFIKDYSKMARPLNALMSKNKTFEWTKECEDSFKILKEKFETQPVLAMPDPLKPFEIECDASMNAAGAVLYQNDKNGTRHPIAYFSKGFTPAERNYHCSEQEFFAIILALREWRHYIQGSPHLTVIWTDHENLTRWRKLQQLSRRQVRWTQDIQEFNVLIKHLPGKKNGPADELSRRPDHVPAEKDNHDMIALPDNLFDDKQALPITIIDEKDLKDIKSTKGFEK